MATLGVVQGAVARSIRALERDDVEAAADLYERIARSGGERAPHGLAEFLERTLFDHPWADREIPSLVYQRADGRIVGFLASHVRRLSLDGESLRAGCSGQLVTDLDARSAVVGTLLLRAYMAGAQDLTFTDTASAAVQRLWEGLGGDAAAAQSVGWFRVLRPCAFAADYTARRRGPRFGAVGRAAGFPVDAVARRLRPLRVPPPPHGALEELTPAALVEALAETAESLRLLPAYDEPFLDYLFAEMARVAQHGDLVRSLVRDGDGRPLGWFVYYLRQRGISTVLQVGGRGRDLGAVLDHLFDHAAGRGSAGLQGRLEPRLLDALTARGAMLHPSGYLSLVHTGRPDVLAALASGRSLMTRMEGEWWMGYHLLPFADGGAP